MHSFVGGELSFLKLCSVLVFFFESQHSQIAVFEVSCAWVLPCRLKLKWSLDKSIIKLSLVLCVLMIYWWSLIKGTIFHLAEGIKLKLSGERSGFVHFFLHQSCINFGLAHLIVHMT